LLADFILENRDRIVANARRRVESRTSPRPSELEVTDGIPIFLDQLVDALRLMQAGGAVDHTQIAASAGRHGQALLDVGLTIGQVVHDYGDVCQVITALADQQGAPIPADDFRTLNLCLDDAIAAAVTTYARQREYTIADQGTERLGVLAHEMRNLLNTATLAFESIKTGLVAVGGSTGLLHERCLVGLSGLIDRSLAEVRLDAGLGRSDSICVAELIEEIEIGASIQAKGRGLTFTVTSVDPSISIEGDRQTISAAVSNLLQNAFKFTHRNGAVSLTASATADHVLFEIEDQCGGLPPGSIAELFRPFAQRSADRSGVGLGLSICLKAAHANRGEIRVRDLPGRGCVFTLELPRTAPRPRAASGPHPVVRKLP
jgi:signal transduction histidine kinase